MGILSDFSIKQFRSNMFRSVSRSYDVLRSSPWPALGLLKLASVAISLELCTDGMLILVAENPRCPHGVLEVVATSFDSRGEPAQASFRTIISDSH
jgi:hypothetical protein